VASSAWRIVIRSSTLVIGSSLVRGSGRSYWAAGRAAHDGHDPLGDLGLFPLVEVPVHGLPGREVRRSSAPTHRDSLDDAGESLITVEAALDWARLPAAGGSNWSAYRLSAVRGFAAYLHTRDFRHEVRGSRSTTGSGIRSVTGVSLLDRSYTVVLQGPRRRLTAAGESADVAGGFAASMRCC
jgi:hypothetical protein